MNNENKKQGGNNSADKAATRKQNNALGKIEMFLCITILVCFNVIFFEADNILQGIIRVVEVFFESLFSMDPGPDRSDQIGFALPGIVWTACMACCGFWYYLIRQKRG